MGRAARWHAVRAARWSSAAEGRTSAALLLAAHGLRVVAEAAEARGDETELAADLHAPTHGAEQLERDVLGVCCTAADRQFAAQEANPRLPFEASG